ncbi:MAG: type IV pilin N-terminal domain-containing protein [Euryarchaeota archaeon]|nr:type IV pilin N-terminal domain-containing protein [Euryarchaeota archaeon]
MKKQKNVSIARAGSCRSHRSCYFLRDETAVSEVIGNVLLIGIAISLFTMLVIVVLNVSFLYYSAPSPTVSISGCMNDPALTIVLEHLGGDALPRGTQIRFTIADRVVTKSVDLLDSSSQLGEEWNVGEKLSYNYSTDSTFNGLNVPQVSVRVAVIDVQTGTMVLNSLIQDGSALSTPWASTYAADNITQTSATLHMKYDFLYGVVTLQVGTNCKKVYFEYYMVVPGQEPSDWPWQNISTDICTLDDAIDTGYYDDTFDVVLEPGATYKFRAVAEYKMFKGEFEDDGITRIYTLENSTGSTLSFTTPTYVVGRWSFDDGSGVTANDTSGNNNHLLLFPGINFSEPLRPQWKTLPDVVAEGALGFDGVNDHADSPQPSSHTAFNFADRATVEAWIKPGINSSGTYGSVNLLNVSVFGEKNLSFYEVEIVPVAGELYVLVGRNSNSKYGYVATIRIAANGSIVPANISSSFLGIYQFELTYCVSPQIICVNATSSPYTYAIVYCGYNGGYNTRGIIKLVNVDLATGIITAVVSATVPFVFDTNLCYTPDVIKVNGSADLYAVVYAIDYLNSRYGRVIVVNISNSAGWSITNKSWVDFYTVESVIRTKAKMWEPDIINISKSADTYAIMYRGVDDDGYIRRITINSVNGNIGATTGDLQCFDDANGWFPQITYVDGYVYAVIYGGSKGNTSSGIYGVLQIFTLDPTGGLGAFYTSVANVTVESTIAFNNPRIVAVGGGHFAVVYRGPSSWGYLKTYNISASAIVFKRNLTFEKQMYGNPPGSGFDWPTIILLGPSVCAIVYKQFASEGDLNDGRIKTYPILASNGSIGAMIDSCILTEMNNLDSFDFIKVSGDVYAIVYNRGDTKAGYVKTFNISSDGKIGKSFLADYKFDSNDSCFYFDVVALGTSGGYQYFAIYYLRNYSTNRIPTLTTIKIKEDGTEILRVESWNNPMNYSSPLYPKIVHLANSVYATLYKNNSDGRIVLMTWQISATGVITYRDNLSLASSTTATMTFCYDIILVNETSHLVALVYSNVSQRPVMSTLRIDPTSGVIDDPSIVETGFDTYTLDCIDPQILSVTDNVYAVFFRDSETLWQIKTFFVESGGTCRVLDLGNHWRPGLHSGDIWTPIFGSATIHVVGDIFVSALSKGTTSCTTSFVTFRITPQGEISFDIKADQTRDNIFSSTSKFQKMISVNEAGHIYAILVQGDNADGGIATMRVDPIKKTKDIQVIFKNNWCNITSNDTVVMGQFAIKNSGGSCQWYSINLSLHYSDYLGTWKYLGLTFNSTANPPTMTFYNFYGMSGSSPLNVTGTMVLPAGSTLYVLMYDEDYVHMGYYNAIFDEILIHHMDQPQAYFERRYLALGGV